MTDWTLPAGDPGSADRVRGRDDARGGSGRLRTPRRDVPALRPVPDDVPGDRENAEAPKLEEIPSDLAQSVLAFVRARAGKKA